MSIDYETMYRNQVADLEACKAALAEMRAALEAVMRSGNAFHEQECNQDPCTCWVVEASAALSRTDLGRGCVVVPRESAVRWRHVVVGTIESMKPTWSNSNVAILLRQVQHDLDALLADKGGG